LDFQAETFTFTTTGAVLCPSGTFVDELQAVGGAENQPKVNLQFRTVYTCDDGSGSFFAQKHVFLVFDEESGTSTNSGPITLKGGTDAYVGLSGHGTDSGTADEFAGVGNISGELKLS
jgi:hypothetical protein